MENLERNTKEKKWFNGIKSERFTSVTLQLQIIGYHHHQNPHHHIIINHHHHHHHEIDRQMVLGKWECLHTGSWDPISGLVLYRRKSIVIVIVIVISIIAILAIIIVTMKIGGRTK